VQADHEGYGAEVRHCCAATAKLALRASALALKQVAVAAPQSLTPTPLYQPLVQQK